MWLLDAPRLVVALALFAALAAALFAGRAGSERLIAGGVALAACALLALSAATNVLQVTFGGSDRAQAERWTPLSRVLGFLPSVLGGRADAPGRGNNGVVIYDRVIGEIVPLEGGRHPRVAAAPARAPERRLRAHGPGRRADHGRRRRARHPQRAQLSASAAST